MSFTWRQARQFHAVLGGAIACGIALAAAPIAPMRFLFLSGLLNGVLAPPLLLIITLVSRNPRVMGRHLAGRWLAIGGWVTMVLMTLCVIGIVATRSR